MKKTLITLAALAASVASAAVVTNSYTLADFSNGSMTLDTSLDFTTDFTISGSVTIGNSNTNGWGTPLISTAAGVNDVPSVGGFKFYATNWQNGNGDDKLTSTFYNGSSMSEAVAALTSKVEAGDVITFTYTYSADTKAASLVFNDGTDTITRTADYTGLGLTSITGFTTAIGSGEATTTDWALAITTAVGTEDIVTPDTPDTPGDAIPEPTTATLSLLALAGLAARRRRK